MRKDLGIAPAEAARHGARPVTEPVARFHAGVQAAGGGRWDTSSLITRLGSGVHGPVAGLSGGA
jgi:3-hydroxyisobutyrate dehydrogenase